MYNETLPGKEFVLRAIEFYNKRLDNPIFVASSDDKDYLFENFLQIPNLYVSGGKYCNL